jgi:hypothetical protein
VTKGIYVVLGDQAMEVALPLARDTQARVYVQLRDNQAVARARKQAVAVGADRVEEVRSPDRS